jgi:hypothetical protein
MNKQTDEDILTYDVSDDALEAAGAATAAGAVTLIQGSYCFTCSQKAQQVAFWRDLFKAAVQASR